MKRSGKRYSGKPDGRAGTPKERRLHDYMTTSCWGDVVFTEKNFVNIRAISWMEDLRNSGIWGLEEQRDRGIRGVFHITSSLKKVQSLEFKV